MPTELTIEDYKMREKNLLEAGALVQRTIHAYTMRGGSFTEMVESCQKYGDLVRSLSESGS